jgi:hypothetical protein
VSERERERERRERREREREEREESGPFAEQLDKLGLADLAIVILINPLGQFSLDGGNFLVQFSQSVLVHLVVVVLDLLF